MILTSCINLYLHTNNNYKYIRLTKVLNVIFACFNCAFCLIFLFFVQNLNINQLFLLFLNRKVHAKIKYETKTYRIIKNIFYASHYI